ncbi:MAG: hypothetical protein IT158_24960 [Bryobacterales bacterium]|nr:hypothetical protein [Bryobacterales bacterium]
MAIANLSRVTRKPLRRRPRTSRFFCAAACFFSAARLAMIAGVQAGADVYVQKPISVVVVEGQAMLAAARKYKRVVHSRAAEQGCDWLPRPVPSSSSFHSAKRQSV